MTPAESIVWLRHAAYSLYHIESLEESRAGGYLYDVIADAGPGSEDSTLQNITEALEWALKCDSLDWEQILPNLPHTDAFKRQHLAILLDRLHQGR